MSNDYKVIKYARQLKTAKIIFEIDTKNKPLKELFILQNIRVITQVDKTEKVVWI